jgi:SAM-dependent methyltransferase
VLRDDGDVLFAEYDSLAHSFWRAQELSLFRRHRDLLAGPVLDFGCGDGTFAALLFDRLAYGVDNDPAALAIAERFGLYETLVRAADDRIPLPDGAAGSILSNSVLEHVVRLDAVLAELARVLRPGGALLFTAPVRGYAEHLTAYFGAAESARVNAESSHHNLFGADEWCARLRAHGLEPVLVQHYQPDWFTYWYRMFRLVGDRGLGHFVPGLRRRIWERRQGRLMAMVRDSIRPRTDGANVFVVARRAPSGA